MEATVKLEISDAEWEVMRIVWTLGESNSRQITENLAAKMGWKSATVKTLLGRLVKKQALATQKSGNAFTYTPLVEEQDAMDSATRALFGHLCQMKVGQTLSDLIDNLTLSKANIAEIQQQLAAKVETAPDTVSCNCLPEGCSSMVQDA